MVRDASQCKTLNGNGPKNVSLNKFLGKLAEKKRREKSNLIGEAASK